MKLRACRLVSVVLPFATLLACSGANPTRESSEHESSAALTGGVLVVQPNDTAGASAIVQSAHPLTPTPAAYGWVGATAWTWSGSPGAFRGLLKFDFSGVPPSSTVTQAILTLSPDPSVSGILSESTLSGSNSATLRSVTSAWDAATVNWATQPTTTTDHQVQLAASTSPTQQRALDVTALVTAMLRSQNGNGFMLQLDTEQAYRSLMFASSNNVNAALRPRLEVQYTTAPGSARIGSSALAITVSGKVAVGCNGVNTLGFDIGMTDSNSYVGDENDPPVYEIDIMRSGIVERSDTVSGNCQATTTYASSGVCTKTSNNRCETTYTDCRWSSLHYDVGTVGDYTVQIATREPGKTTFGPPQGSGWAFSLPAGSPKVPCPLGTLTGGQCQVAVAPPGSTTVLSNNLPAYKPRPSCPMPGSTYDTANCWFSALPSHSQRTFFTFEGGLYYSPTVCPLPNSLWAPGTNNQTCMMGTPSSAFVLNGNMYYVPINGTCPVVGSQSDSRNCWFPGYSGLRSSGNVLYYAPHIDCAFIELGLGNASFHGTYDSANCFLGRPPTTPFIFNNAAYYGAVPSQDCSGLAGSVWNGNACTVAIPAGAQAALLPGNALGYAPVCQ